jgi:hypothetical protein
MSEVSFVVAPCVRCGLPFLFNPERVPSLRVNDAGELDPLAPRKPVCRTCWDERQAYRRTQGLAEEALLPGAYEPVIETLEGDLDEW